jgi:hypothetical protein
MLSKANSRGSRASLAVSSGVSEELRSSLLTTLYFVALFFPINKSDPALVDTLKKWEELLNGDEVQGQAADSIRLLSRFLKEGYLGSRPCILEFLEHCSQKDSAHKDSLINAWLYAYLRSEVTSKLSAAKLYMGTLFVRMKQKNISVEEMLSLAYMLREVVTLHPLKDEKLLSSAMQVVKRFLLWPAPYCFVAEDLYRLLQRDMQMPGSAIRERLEREYPDLRGDEVSGSEGTVTIFVNKAARFGTIFREMLREPPQDHVTIVTWRRVLLELMLKAEDKPEGFLAHVPDGVIQEKYNQAVALLEKSSPTQEEKNNELQQILSELLESYPVPEGQRPIAMPNVLPHLQLDVLELQPISNMMDYERITVDRDSNSSEAAEPRCFFNPPATQALRKLLQKSRQQGIVARIGIAGGQATWHAMVGAYVAALCADAGSVSHFLEPQFYLIPAGQENRLASFISRVDSWYERHILLPVTNAVRVLPSIQPQAMDKIMAKRLGLGLKTSSSSGKIDITAGEKDKENDKKNTDDLQQQQQQQQMEGEEVRQKSVVTSPAKFLRFELETYFREADRIMRLTVFEATCHVAMGTKECYSVAFTHSASIGLETAIECYRQEMRLPQLSGAEVQAQSDFDFGRTHPPLLCSYTSVDLNGNSLEEGQLPSAGQEKVHRLSGVTLSHVASRHVAHSQRPNPTAGWLEVNAQVDMPLVTGEKTSGSSSKKSSGGPRGLVEQRLHASRVTVSSGEPKKKRFMLLLDGIRYGPVYKVTFAPLCLAKLSGTGAASGATPLSIPIMTFFPKDKDFINTH